MITEAVGSALYPVEDGSFVVTLTARAARLTAGAAVGSGDGA